MMSVSRIYVFAVWCLQMHWFMNKTYYRCISCSFPNHLTNVIIYPKTRFCFRRLGYTLLEFIIVITIILMHGIAYYSVHVVGLWNLSLPQSTRYFYAVSHMWTIFDIIIFQLGKLFSCLCCVLPTCVVLLSSTKIMTKYCHNWPFVMIRAAIGLRLHLIYSEVAFCVGRCHN